jgi:hypothetical protein
VHTAMNLLSFIKQGISWLDQKLSVSQEGLCSMQLAEPFRHWSYMAYQHAFNHAFPDCLFQICNMLPQWSLF